MRSGAGYGCGVILAAFALGACLSPNNEQQQAASAGSAGWTRPPSIQTVTTENDSLVVSGLAEPAGRVVLRGESGVAYGSVADADGGFRIRVPVRAETLLLRPETQVGQDSAASADRLLVVAGSGAPIALLRQGSATRRLDRPLRLGAVDNDGRVTVASGIASSPIIVEAGGRQTTVRPDPSRRWDAVVELGAGGGAIQAGDQISLWPGAGAEQDSDPVAQRAGEGWRVIWETSPGVMQSTWLPDEP